MVEKSCQIGSRWNHSRKSWRSLWCQRVMDAPHTASSRSFTACGEAAENQGLTELEAELQRSVLEANNLMVAFKDTLRLNIEHDHAAASQLDCFLPIFHQLFHVALFCKSRIVATERYVVQHWDVGLWHQKLLQLESSTFGRTCERCMLRKVVRWR